MSRKDIMRLTTIAASAAALALTAGGMAVAVAEPGPNGKNDFGLCTAYEARNKNKEKDNTPPPFAGLETAAEAKDMTIEEWCSTYGTDPGGQGNESEPE